MSFCLSHMCKSRFRVFFNLSINTSLHISWCKTIILERERAIASERWFSRVFVTGEKQRVWVKKKVFFFLETISFSQILVDDKRNSAFVISKLWFFSDCLIKSIFSICCCHGCKFARIKPRYINYVHFFIVFLSICIFYFLANPKSWEL